MIRLPVAIVTLLVVLAGCGQPARVDIPPGHPANPDAVSAPIPSPSTTLTSSTVDASKTEVSPATGSGTSGHHHMHGGEPAESAHAGHADATAGSEPGHATAAGADENRPTHVSHYTCTMHPEVSQEQPGKCPQCGMTLKKMDADHDADGRDHPAMKPDESKAPPAPTGTKPAEEHPSADRYTCAMHPDVIQDAPGKCPKCGMKLKKMEGAHP